MRGWEIPERCATPESLFLSRRNTIKGLGSIGLFLAGGALTKNVLASHGENTPNDPSRNLYPVKQNVKFKLKRELTPEDFATHYNNYYEFGSQKKIFGLAQKLPLRPWTLTIDGLVKNNLTINIDDLLNKMPMEERLYRHRCVEAWSLAVPYSGFTLKSLINLVEPLGSAQYLALSSFNNPKIASGQRQFWYPWPYTDGLTIEEATNDLSFIATGYYGKPIPKQNGAPLRLAVPWKYGFKHVKGITRITFTEKRPISFWEKIASNEYGFWANVNPEVSHPRWSQKIEKFYGPNGVEHIPTQIFNGYAEFVSDLYQNKLDEPLFK